MTNDSKHFIERSVAQVEGYALDSFGHWLKGLGDLLNKLILRFEINSRFHPMEKPQLQLMI